MTIQTEPHPIPVKPRDIASDERFHTDPSAFYAELAVVLMGRMGNEAGAEEVSKVWYEAQQISSRGGAL